MRGRASPLTLMFASVVEQAVREAGADPARLPSVFGFKEFVEAGGLLSYGASRRVLFGRPIQQPTKFEIVINARAAKELGLSVPLTLQAQADEVIE